VTCYEIPYKDRWGGHVSTKWGGTPQEAVACLRKSLSAVAEIGTPVAMNPQPFSEEARALRVRRAA
jgi:hypothetical protein